MSEPTIRRLVIAVAAGCLTVMLGGAAMTALTGDKQWLNPEFGKAGTALLLAWVYLVPGKTRKVDQQ